MLAFSESWPLGMRWALAILCAILGGAVAFASATVVLLLCGSTGHALSSAAGCYVGIRCGGVAAPSNNRLAAIGLLLVPLIVLVCIEPLDASLEWCGAYTVMFSIIASLFAIMVVPERFAPVRLGQLFSKGDGWYGYDRTENLYSATIERSGL
jgi:hypothetical protein